MPCANLHIDLWDAYSESPARKPNFYNYAPAVVQEYVESTLVKSKRYAVTWQFWPGET